MTIINSVRFFLNVYHLLQAAEKNKEDFRSLAKTSCLIMVTLAERVNPDDGSEPTTLYEDATQLYEYVARPL